jgi:inosine-uridine nucleoside N-ribohydrolase
MPPEKTLGPLNVIIDTDAGDDVDDVLALAFALLCPELAIRALTTVTADADKRAQIVAQLLKVMGREDIPYAPGMNLPLRQLSTEEFIRLTAPGFRLNQYPFVKSPAALVPPREDAIQLIGQTAEQYAGDIALIGIGPLTNIATALRRYPKLASQLKWIAIMGAELHLNHREHNIRWDPDAASIVFNSGVPLFVGTWSATRKFVLLPEDCERIKAAGTPLTDALSECIELWWPTRGGKPGPVMYDVAPILWSIDRSYYPTEWMHLVVENRSELTMGMTTRGEGMPNADVTTDMKADEVKRLYLETIGVR